jgi:hypothetical protein
VDVIENFLAQEVGVKLEKLFVFIVQVGGIGEHDNAKAVLLSSSVYFRNIHNFPFIHSLCL